MNGLANLAWAVMCIALGLYFLVYLIAEHATVRRRAHQAFRLIAAAGPCFVAAALSWACRGRSPSQAHPAARAVSAPGWSPLSDEEAWGFGVIADLIEAGVEAPEPEYKTPRGEAS